MVSPGSSVTAEIVDSAIISGPAAVLPAAPLARASPFTVMVLPLRFVRTDVVSVNWHVPDEGAVPSFTMLQTLAALVWIKLFVVSKVPDPCS